MKDVLKDKTGLFSSKRLGYLISLPAANYGTIFICNKLIENQKYDLAADVWSGFLIFVAILGGFVTFEALSDLIVKITTIYKN